MGAFLLEDSAMYKVVAGGILFLQWMRPSP